MPNYMPDPDLNRLVQELNTGGTVKLSKPAADLPETVEVPTDHATSSSEELRQLIRRMIHEGASDLLLVSGSSPVLRINGELRPAGGPALDGDDIRDIFAGFITPKISQQVETSGSADFSIQLHADDSTERRRRRFRANLHRQRGEFAAAIRALPVEIPTLEQLNLPSSLSELVMPKRGLVLVCGPTGAGKSSTLAALVGEINRKQSRHVITIEDPIEYEHRNAKALIEQVEVGRDAPSFASALRASLRQDPDVILVGEMRDLETVSTALTAAETGHLILSTLHTSDAAQAINRIVDVFPPKQQSQVYKQLALSINAILCQQLIPRSDGYGRLPAIELLLANYPVRQHIRSEKLQNLHNELVLGKRHGMITLEDSLAALVRQGMITMDEALSRASHPDEIRGMQA